MGQIGSRIRIQASKSWLVTMQKISLIAQSVLKLSHREKVHDDNDNDDADTNPTWIIVRDGIYSVADKKNQAVYTTLFTPSTI